MRSVCSAKTPRAAAWRMERSREERRGHWRTDTPREAVEMAQVRTQEVEEGSRSERHVEVAGGRWVRESQPVSGVANPGAWGRGTDILNQGGGVSHRSWLLMR